MAMFAENAFVVLLRAEKETGVALITRTKGKRKRFDRNKDWHCEYFSDADPNRCYTFRIRPRRNDKGELVEAYYGKIYGDFELEGGVIFSCDIHSPLKFRSFHKNHTQGSGVRQ